MREFRIQRAFEAHASGVARVIQAVWSDHSVDIQRVTRVICDGVGQVWVAVDHQDEVVGFCHGFTKPDANGNEQIELDLLAVHPDWQRLGAASRLIAAFETAWPSNLPIRALVQVQNRGMQHVLRKLGYTARPAAALYTATGRHTGTTAPSSRTLYYHADTLLYGGTWIEGYLSERALRHGLDIYRGNLVGVVIPQNRANLIAVAWQLGYRHVGDYQHWVIRAVAEAPPSNHPRD